MIHVMYLLTPHGLTGACENITFMQLRLRVVNMKTRVVSGRDLRIKNRPRESSYLPPADLDICNRCTLQK